MITNPLAVYDVGEHNWKGLTEDQRQAVRDWAPGEGIDLGDVLRLEIHVIDCPLARLSHRARDADGNLVVQPCEPYDVLRLPPVDVLIATMPPVEPATTEGGSDGPPR